MSGNLKLAVRNVRRQFENYLIYFLTVALTVALLFAVNNVFFGKELAQHIDMTSDFKNGMKALIVLIALIVSFVLGYATSFMLKLRKREFGTYLTLGMSRNNLLAIFLALADTLRYNRCSFNSKCEEGGSKQPKAKQESL